MKEILENLAGNGIRLRRPVSTDGMSVYRLVKACPPLDVNSSYCNLLQCTHFAATSVAAEKNGELVGFISGYVQPNTPDTLFIWQVAVHDKARGCGLATAMLQFLIHHQHPRVAFLETTITETNDASWALFTRFAQQASTSLHQSEFFEQKKHFDGEHDSELLVRIGPFDTSSRE